jgi:phage terminase Nu1 subunit (DNA packaging protein)
MNLDLTHVIIMGIFAVVGFFLKGTMEDLKAAQKDIAQLKTSSEVQSNLIKSETKNIYKKIDDTLARIEQLVKQQNDHVMEHIDLLREDLKDLQKH